MRSLFKRKGSKKQAASGKALATEVPDDYESSTAESDERDDDALPVYQGSGQYKESKNTKGFKHGKESNIRSRDGVPIITSEGADHFSPSAVSGKNNYAVSGFFTKQKDHTGSNRPRVRPAAKAAAFGGAPRYDWMDIVSFFLRGRKMRTHMMCVLFEMSLLLSLTNYADYCSYRKLPLPSKSKRHGVVFELKSISTEPASPPPVCAIVAGSATLDPKLAIRGHVLKTSLSPLTCVGLVYCLVMPRWKMRL